MALTLALAVSTAMTFFMTVNVLGTHKHQSLIQFNEIFLFD